MAKEGSVAPKERVNITYKPATGDAQEEVELPLRFLVMGDFTQKPNLVDLQNRKPVGVDKDNFNSVLESMDVGVDLSVTNRLTDGEPDPDDQLSVSLSFKTMRDFEPDNIAQRVPELRQLVELREALKSLKGPLGNVPAFRKKLETLVRDDATKERLLAELNINQDEQ